ncbi:MAG TPA: hypothetical protein VHA77_12320 [Xanthobacteraceae bacterium]|nr:hypothetical protein [Xanthobacteraceae bacterium]
MSKPPSRDDEAEVEIVCTHCGYRTTRTVARLRRETMVMCPACGAPITPERQKSEKSEKNEE